MGSREAVVDYMTPLGLHHLMGTGHHYGPGAVGQRSFAAGLESALLPSRRCQWHRLRARPERQQCHRAVFAEDRGAVSPIRRRCRNIPAVVSPRVLGSQDVFGSHALGRAGVSLHSRRRSSETDAPHLGRPGAVRSIAERFAQVAAFLAIQEQEAKWWRDACIAYFQSFSKRPLPAGFAPPAHSLEYYQSLKFPYAPGRG